MRLTHHNYNDFESKRELRLKGAFLRAPLQVTDFVPGTGIGKFDLSFSPSTNKITITVKVAYEFSRDQKRPEQIAWDEQSKLKFRQDAKPLIENFWSGAYTLTCARPGWHDVFADVEIDYLEVPLKQARYVVKVMRLAKFKSAVVSSMERCPTCAA